MIRSLYLVTLTLLIQNWCLAQASDSVRSNPDYIVNTKTYNRGVYKTFEEFKYNRPSVTDFSIYEGRPIVTNQKTGKKRAARARETWGFCDGSKIYVRRSKYFEMVGMGRYCYFREKGVKLALGIAPPYILPIPIPYSHVIIVNFNTGKSYILKKRLFKVILTADDQELLGQYQADTQKRKKLIGYVNLYNQRNVHRIK